MCVEDSLFLHMGTAPSIPLLRARLSLHKVGWGREVWGGDGSLHINSTQQPPDATRMAVVSGHL